MDIGNGSHVLLDTCVLIDSSKHPSSFIDFYEHLRIKNAVPVLEKIVETEFLRSSQRQDVGRLLLDCWFGEDRLLLSITAETFKDALDISQVYTVTGTKPVALPDLLIAAQAKKYARLTADYRELIIATSNHFDFPPVLFDLLYVQNIRLSDGKIRTVGFYRFSLERFNSIKKNKV